MKPAPGLPLEQQPEAFLEQACLWDEARGEHALGIVAVDFVIHTRAREHGITVKQVILAPMQFSGFNPGAKDRAWMLNAWRTDPHGWLYVEQAMALALSSGDPTHGANHYYAPAWSNPAWGRGSPQWEEHCVIGHHIFGRCP